MDDALAQAAAQPWVLYILGGLAVLLVLSQVTEVGLGRVGRAWRAWAETKRAMTNEQSLADIAELKRQVEALSAELERLRSLQAPHAEWDREVYRALLTAGHPVSVPPPVF